MESSNSTQLSDRYPQIDAPLRIDPPLSMNITARNESQPKEFFVSKNAFSPSAFTQRPAIFSIVSSTTTRKLDGQGGREKLALSPIKTSKRAEQMMGGKSSSSSSSPSSHFNVLVSSSKRSGNLQMEGSALLSMAILLDNQGEYERALDKYDAYLQVSISLEDVVGQCLALNCIGVDYMNLACPPTDVGISETQIPPSSSSSSSSSPPPPSHSLLHHAMEVHLKHAELADEGGRFVALTNLGLCSSLLSSSTSSSSSSHPQPHSSSDSSHFHQQALRLSLSLNSIYGQAIAVGNLGLLALKEREWTVAKSCLEQHLQLVQSLDDHHAEITAWTHLSRAFVGEGDLDQAQMCLEEGKSVARRRGASGMLKRLSCLLGMIRGQMEMGNMMTTLLIQCEERERVRCGGQGDDDVIIDGEGGSDILILDS